MSETYRTASGTVTERLRVDLEPAEAAAFTDAWHHLREHVDVETHPIFAGLRRIATAYAAEYPEAAEEPQWWGGAGE